MVTESLERRRLLASVYAQDFGFGVAGHADAPADQLVAPLPGGRTLVVGTHVTRRFVGGDTEEDRNTIVSRINADGVVDATVNLQETQAVAFLAGHLYVASETVPVGEAICRYDADGTLDTTFSGDGHVSVPIASPFDQFDFIDVSLTATPDGELLVHTTDGVHQLSKLKPDGSLDVRFGNHGFITLPELSSDAIAVPLHDGVLIFSPDPTGHNDVRRYRNDGTLDTSFADQGVLTLPQLPTIREQPDGKLVYSLTSFQAGGGATTAQVTRLNADGSVDASFGDNGTVRFPNRSAVALLIDAQQRIVVGLDQTVVRLTSTGATDAFPFNGTRIPRFDGSSVIAFGAGGRLLASTGNTLTRFDAVDPVVLANDHVLYVTGSTDDDRVAITSPKRDQIKVSLNGVVTRLDARAISGINVDAGEGNNSVFVPLNRHVVVAAGAGDDSLVTGAGKDVVNAGAGADTIVTGDGNDTIEAGLGSNVIDCGDGADRVITHGDDPSGTASNVITGGDGNKDIDYAGGGGSTITLGVGDSEVTADDLTGDDHITIAGGSNNVHPSGGHDVVQIRGSGANFVAMSNGTFDVVTGAGRDSFLFDISSAATIDSGAGDDSVASFDGHGPYLIRTGDGNDVVQLQALTAATVYGGAGNDFLQTADGVQVLNGGSGKDTIIGGPGADLISGNGGDDSLYGEGGRDRILGGDGDDLLHGGSAVDILSGGAGNDTLDGGGGGDQRSGGSGNNVIADAGAARAAGAARTARARLGRLVDDLESW